MRRPWTYLVWLHLAPTSPGLKPPKPKPAARAANRKSGLPGDATFRTYLEVQNTPAVWKTSILPMGRTVASRQEKFVSLAAIRLSFNLSQTTQCLSDHARSENTGNTSCGIVFRCHLNDVKPEQSIFRNNSQRPDHFPWAKPARVWAVGRRCKARIKHIDVDTDIRAVMFRAGDGKCLSCHIVNALSSTSSMLIQTIPNSLASIAPSSGFRGPRQPMITVRLGSTSEAQ